VGRYLVAAADLWLSSFLLVWRKKRGYCFKKVSYRTKGCERPISRTTLSGLHHRNDWKKMGLEVESTTNDAGERTHRIV
jgi:hypothetical protein